MPWFLLGIALLVALLLLARWYAHAEVATLKKALYVAALAAALAVAGFLLATGRFAFAMWALPALFVFLMRLRAIYRNARNQARMSQAGPGGGTGQASDLETRFLRMRLDHDTGDLTGEVKEGPFAGRALHDMPLADLLNLLRQCRAEDGQSAQVLEAYLDRLHADWRAAGTGAGAGSAGAAPPAGGMTRAQALAVLGLAEGATRDEIKAAYHRIIASLHPDRGGSDFLAAMVNEAKSVLLGD